MIITLTKKVDAILAKKSRVTDCVQWDNTKQARMPYFHCGPFKKKKKKRSKIGKKEKEKKGQGVAKISLDRIQKEKYPKKDINDDDINDEGKK